MKDPWRPDEPLRPEPVPQIRPGKKVNLGDDLDDDLREPGVHRFACRGGSVKVEHIAVNSVSDALYRLVACLHELWKDEKMRPTFRGENVSAKLGEVIVGAAFLVDDAATIFTTSEDYEPYAQLRLVNQVYDDGMIRLLRLLKSAEHRHPEILATWGIVPMLR